MSISTWAPRNFTCKVDFIKSTSIKHKTICSDEVFIMLSELNGVRFKLQFRNYYKQRYLSCIIYKDNHTVTIEHDSLGFITGHAFISFLKTIYELTDSKSIIELLEFVECATEDAEWCQSYR